MKRIGNRRVGLTASSTSRTFDQYSFLIAEIE